MYDKLGSVLKFTYIEPAPPESEILESMASATIILLSSIQIDSGVDRCGSRFPLQGRCAGRVEVILVPFIYFHCHQRFYKYGKIRQLWTVHLATRA